MNVCSSTSKISTPTSAIFTPCRFPLSAATGSEPRDDKTETNGNSVLAQAKWMDAGKASLWHRPGFLSLVADRYAPRLRCRGNARVALAVIVNL
jgi:hypothetical protein